MGRGGGGGGRYIREEGVLHAVYLVTLSARLASLIVYAKEESTRVSPSRDRGESLHLRMLAGRRQMQW